MLSTAGLSPVAHEFSLTSTPGRLGSESYPVAPECPRTAMAFGYWPEACVAGDVAWDEGDVVAAVPPPASPDDEHDASSAHTTATRTSRPI